MTRLGLVALRSAKVRGRWEMRKRLAGRNFGKRWKVGFCWGNGFGDSMPQLGNFGLSSEGGSGGNEKFLVLLGGPPDG